ncbi:MAG: hypothetical protein ACREQI_16415 [Candidatus Binataceae bacterium]
MNLRLRVFLAAILAIAAAPSMPALAAGKAVPFSRLSAVVRTEPHEVRVGAGFTLGKDSKGIDPITQPATIRLDKLLFAVPPNSFRKTDLGWFAYSGTIGGNAVEIEIIPVENNSFILRAEIAGKKFKTPAPGAIKVQISVGNDVGVVETRAWQAWY